MVRFRPMASLVQRGRILLTFFVFLIVVAGVVFAIERLRGPTLSGQANGTPEEKDKYCCVSLDSANFNPTCSGSLFLNYNEDSFNDNAKDQVPIDVSIDFGRENQTRFRDFTIIAQGCAVRGSDESCKGTNTNEIVVGGTRQAYQVVIKTPTDGRKIGINDQCWYGISGYDAGQVSNPHATPDKQPGDEGYIPEKNDICNNNKNYWVDKDFFCPLEKTGMKAYALVGKIIKACGDQKPDGKGRSDENNSGCRLWPDGLVYKSQAGDKDVAHDDTVDSPSVGDDILGDHVVPVGNPDDMNMEPQYAGMPGFWSRFLGSLPFGDRLTGQVAIGGANDKFNLKRAQCADFSSDYFPPSPPTPDLKNPGLKVTTVQKTKEVKLETLPLRVNANDPKFGNTVSCFCLGKDQPTVNDIKTIYTKDEKTKKYTLNGNDVDDIQAKFDQACNQQIEITELCPKSPGAVSAFCQQECEEYAVPGSDRSAIVKWCKLGCECGCNAQIAQDYATEETIEKSIAGQAKACMNWQQANPGMDCTKMPSYKDPKVIREEQLQSDQAARIEAFLASNESGVECLSQCMRGEVGSCTSSQLTCCTNYCKGTAACAVPVKKQGTGGQGSGVNGGVGGNPAGGGGAGGGGAGSGGETGGTTAGTTGGTTAGDSAGTTGGGDSSSAKSSIACENGKISTSCTDAYTTNPLPSNCRWETFKSEDRKGDQYTYEEGHLFHCCDICIKEGTSACGANSTYTATPTQSTPGAEPQCPPGAICSVIAGKLTEVGCGGGSVTPGGGSVCIGPTCPAATQCSDGKDNDQDGGIDFLLEAVGVKTGEGFCRDGLDNDNDGGRDFIPPSITWGPVDVHVGVAQPNVGYRVLDLVPGLTPGQVIVVTKATGSFNKTGIRCEDAFALKNYPSREIDLQNWQDIPVYPQKYWTGDSPYPPGTGEMKGYFNNQPTQKPILIYIGAHIVVPAGATTLKVPDIATTGDGTCSFSGVVYQNKNSIGDYECTSLDGISEAAPLGCSDGVDNDGDGKTDFPDDTGCNSVFDFSEIPHDNQCAGLDDNDESKGGGPSTSSRTSSSSSKTSSSLKPIGDIQSTSRSSGSTSKSSGTTTTSAAGGFSYNSSLQTSSSITVLILSSAGTEGAASSYDQFFLPWQQMLSSQMAMMAASSVRDQVPITPSLVAQVTPVCGNSKPEEGEECDDGNTRDFDGCSTDCLAERGRCGDGIVQTLLSEQCEPTTHDASLPYSCDGRCHFYSTLCGNNTVNPGEECDLGKQNTDTPNGVCRSYCSLARCGDGVVDSLKEQCDDGNRIGQDGCSRQCFIERPATNDLAAQIFNLNTPSQPTTIYAPLPEHAPVGSTGPASIAIMAAGAAAGVGLIRRKRQ